MLMLSAFMFVFLVFAAQLFPLPVASGTFFYAQRPNCEFNNSRGRNLPQVFEYRRTFPFRHKGR
jgi:hypothetical protein